MKTFAEQIADLQATRKATADRMKEIQAKATEQSRTLDTGEQEEFDTAKATLATIDKNIVNLRDLEAIEKADAATAQPVDDIAKRKAQGGAIQTLQVKETEKLEPGIAMARYAMAIFAAKGDHAKAFKLAERHFPNTEIVVKTLKAQSEGANLTQMLQVQKAAVAAGTTTDSTWAAPLVYANTFAGDFIGYLRPRTLIGQAQFRPAPFNVRIAGATSGGTGYWVGQGKPKPVTKFDFNAVTTAFTKVATIAVLTQELVRFSDPSAEALVRDMLADAVISRVDNDLFDPDLAAVSGVNPAGLLNGVSPISSGITSAQTLEQIYNAIAALWAPWDSTNIGARPAYYTTPAVARYLATLREPLGPRAFPNLSNGGGTIDGVPVRVSQYLANNGGSGGAPFILVDEAEVYLADDGNVTVDYSDQATIQMDDAPTNASAPVTATSMVSLWQTNSIGLRAERFIWWGPRRSGAIQWIDGFPVAA